MRGTRVGSAAKAVVAAAGALVVALAVLAALSSRLSPPSRPEVLGHPVMAVLSASMTPSIRTGDLVVDDRLSADAARSLRVGQVVTFHPASGGTRLFTHRIVAVRHDVDGGVSYVTKGDANNAADADAVPSSNVVGLYRWRVPKGGYLLAALHRPAALLLVAVMLMLVWVGTTLLRRRGGRPPRGGDGLPRPGDVLPAHLTSRMPKITFRWRLPSWWPVRPVRPPWGRRAVVTGTVATLAAGCVLAGATLALFSSTPGAEGNTVTAGTVSLSAGSSGACTVTGLMPGDSPAPCSFTTTYTGSAPAFLGLDFLIQTQAGSGGTPLYNPPSSNNGVTVTVTDNQGSGITYTVPTGQTTCPNGAPKGSTCYALANELVSTAPVSSSAAVTFSTAVSLPMSAGNGYQGGGLQVILSAHAVQSSNQILPTGCTAGSVCGPTGSFSWS